jgi:hypothetical protein
LEKRLRDVSLELRLNDAEQELVAEFVRQLRGEYYTGAPRRKFSYQQLLEALWGESYRLHCAYERAGNSICVIGEALDAAANVIVAVMIHQPVIAPLLAGLGKRVAATRWGKSA